MRWEDVSSIDSKSYVCGYCGEGLASDRGYFATGVSSKARKRYGMAYIYICHYCDRPTFFSSEGEQTPGPAFGEPVSRIPSEDVKALYEEARNCMKVNAHTAAVMCCRKLLMNVAVAEGADAGLKFWQYVKYLADEGHIPAKATVWVDHIRNKGNDANHEIEIMGREDAERLIKFSGMMLRIMYEYPAEAKDPAQQSAAPIGVPPNPRAARRAPDTSRGSAF